MPSPPTPAPNAETQQKDARARQTVAYAESLKKCPGWSQWFQPKVFAAYDQAKDNILKAAEKGQPAAAADILLYQTLHEFVSSIRQELSLAEKRVGKPPTFE